MKILILMNFNDCNHQRPQSLLKIKYLLVFVKGVIKIPWVPLVIVLSLKIN